MAATAQPTKLNLKYTLGNHNPYILSENSECTTPASKSSPIKYKNNDSNHTYHNSRFNTDYFNSLQNFGTPTSQHSQSFASLDFKPKVQQKSTGTPSVYSQKIASSNDFTNHLDSPLYIQKKPKESHFKKQQLINTQHIYSENNTPTNSYNKVHNHPQKSNFQKMAELSQPRHHYLNEQFEKELQESNFNKQQQTSIQEQQQQKQNQYQNNQEMQKEQQLPPKTSSHKYTLVLDLDETLIHTYNRNPQKKELQFHVRPHAIDFLSDLSQYFELVVFTASPMFYCDAIVNTIDHGKWVQHRLCENHLKYRGEGYVKDMSFLGRDLRHVIIVDNLEINFSAQPENGILIKDFYDDMTDNELYKLNIKLRQLALSNVDDVRPFLQTLKKQFN